MKVALDAARDRDWSRCLTAMLDEWRESRDPKLAELIERVGALVPAEPIASAGLVKRVWARVKAATDGDVSTICAVVVREMRNARQLYTALVLLADRPPDPRVATALLYVMHNPPFARTDGATYGDVIEALEKIDDPRTYAPIIAAWERIEPRFNRMRKEKKGATVLRDVAKKLAAKKPRAPMPAKELAELEALVAAKTPTQKKQSSDTRSLLQAIYDEPLDLSLRLVYADSLLEAGDPRGELITLQCNRGGDVISKRERELLKSYGRAWLGAIEPIVLKSGLAYRNGFVATAREAAKKVAQNVLLEAPEWSTVEELDLTVTWGDRATKFVADPRWKALRTVWDARVEDLVPIDRALPWTRVYFKSAGHTDELAKLAILPDLVELGIERTMRPASALKALASQLIMRSVKCVRISAWENRSELAGSVKIASEIGLAELQFAHNWDLVSENALLVRLLGDHAIVMLRDSQVDFGDVTRLVEHLPQRTIRTVSFELPPRAQILESTWQALVAALAAHGAEPPAKP